MRSGILLWSTFSGVVIGLLAGGALVALALVVGALLPGVAARVGQRWLWAGVVLCLVVLPVVAAVLGFLEGRLKLR